MTGPLGSTAPRFVGAPGTQRGTTGGLLAQAFTVRGLLAAREALQEPHYLEAAQKAYAVMNEGLWDPATGIYRSSPDAEVSVYTPLNLGAALGALREYILATGDVDEYQRFKRFWVQAVDSSGIQQAEYEETGDDDFSQPDSDHDGIPRMEAAGGRYGIAPVYAGRVEIETPLATAPVQLTQKR